MSIENIKKGKFVRNIVDLWVRKYKFKEIKIYKRRNLSGNRSHKQQ